MQYWRRVQFFSRYFRVHDSLLCSRKWWDNFVFLSLISNFDLRNPFWFFLSLSQSEKTPLHLAAEAGRDQVCQLLIEKGANINAQDVVSCTPFQTPQKARKGLIYVISESWTMQDCESWNMRCSSLKRSFSSVHTVTNTFVKNWSFSLAFSSNQGCLIPQAIYVQFLYTMSVHHQVVALWKWCYKFAAVFVQCYGEVLRL